MNQSLQKYQHLLDLQRRNATQSKLNLISMDNQKPHIYPCNRGNPSKQWMCKGLGDCAVARSPSEAYFKWLYRTGGSSHD